jgi:hypothetical protein
MHKYNYQDRSVLTAMQSNILAVNTGMEYHEQRIVPKSAAPELQPQKSQSPAL